jgi:hypothetical protein
MALGTTGGGTHGGVLRRVFGTEKLGLERPQLRLGEVLRGGNRAHVCGGSAGVDAAAQSRGCRGGGDEPDRPRSSECGSDPACGSVHADLLTRLP